MSDRTQDLKNLRAVATRCKNYTDAEIAKSEEKMKWYMGEYSVSTSDDNTSASTKTVPANATRCKIKRLYGLTQKLNPTTASDSTSYSVKTMPATVYDFDISKVEGNSEKSENLIVVEDDNINAQGMTFAFLNGVCNSSGTPSSTGWIAIKRIVLQAGTYYFKDFSTASNKMRIIDSNYNAKTTQPFTLNAETTMFLAITGQSITDNGQLINSMPMLVSGSSEPITYKQGYTGIHNFEWNGVKVEGSNLFDNANTELTGKTFSGANQTVYSYSGFAMKVFNLIIGKTYTITSTKDMRLGFTDDITNSGTYQQTNNYTFTASTSYLLITNRIANEYTEMFENLMLNYGSTALTYAPYIAPTTTTIDLSSILYNGSPLFEGNSLKAVNDVKDSVTPYKATKKLIEIPLKDLDFSASSTASSGIFRAVLTAYNVKYNTGDTPVNALIDSYEAMAFNPLSASDNMKFGIGLRSGTTLTISMINQSFVDNLNGFIASVQDKVLYAEMNSYIEVSINWASLLRGIAGYNNGTISLINTNNQDTANLITYNSIIKENCCAKMVQSRGGNVIKTVTFPTQASDGYSAVSVANIRDFTTNKRETNVDKNSDLGGFTWGYTGQYFWSTDIQSLVKTPQDNSYAANAECKSYSNYPSNNLLGGNLRIAIQSGGSVVVNDTRYDSNTTFKTAMTNEPLYYELADASKTSTDITPIENVIEVEPNDTLAFYDANDNLVTVQSDLTYRIEVAS